MPAQLTPLDAGQTGTVGEFEYGIEEPKQALYVRETISKVVRVDMTQLRQEKIQMEQQIVALQARIAKLDELLAEYNKLAVSPLPTTP